jgi:hypothetical protein
MTTTRHGYQPSLVAPRLAAALTQPIDVESVTWAPGGTLDYWVKERREWWAAYGVQNGHQKWVDLSAILGLK